MKKGDMTREEAIKAAGLDVVEKLDRANCDYTNRVQTDGDPAVEFAATVSYTDVDGDTLHLIAYYYQDEDDLDGVEDLGSLNWEIHGYEII